MQTDFDFREFRRPADRRDLTLILAFGAFSYILLSLWGALVAGNLAVVISPRRIVVCSIGAGIFWLTLRRLKQERRVGLGTLLISIIVAGLAILAVRLGLDQLSTSPIEPEHSVRWSLAWSGYFGIWLLAAVPPCPPTALRKTHPAGTQLNALDDVYLDHLLALPDEDAAK